MSKVVKFNFENSDKVIEINGETYNIPMDDDSKAKYALSIKVFGEGAQELAKNGEALLELDDEAFEEFNIKQREVMKGLIEAILGEGKFEVMYKLAGRSTNNLMPLAQELMVLVGSDESVESIQNKYLQNGKK